MSVKNVKKLSYGTVRNIFATKNIYAYSPIKKPLLSNKNVLKRYELSKKWIKMPVSDVKRIIFSDETKINQHYNDGKCKVWREPGKGLKKENILQPVKFGGISVMIWGCFSYSGIGKIYFIDGIMDAVEYTNILSSCLCESAEKMGIPQYIFQQDNDPKHTSKLAKEYFAENKIDVMDWPAQSPDMNPIENIWALVKRGVIEKNPKNKMELKNAILSVWESITQETTKRYALSFKRRAMELYRAKGRSINY